MGANVAAGSLVLFTRDLRVHDNRALASAEAPVLPLFVFDERLLAGAAGSPRRVAFLLDSIEDLRASLESRGARLVLRSGDPARVALALARDHRLGAIHASADPGPWGRRRERELSAGCRELGVKLVLHDGLSAVSPGSLTPAGRDHYRVFTPYWRAWLAVPAHDPARAPRRVVPVPGVEAGSVPSRVQLRSAPSASGGERAARRVLKRWASGPVARYGGARLDISDGATSHLGPHLHFGTVSPASVLRALPAGDGAEEFARQLCWRDFFLQLLSVSPSLAREDYRPGPDEWRDDARGLEAWCEGRTGFPIVDAGMRQLAAEGYIHNRVRLVVASFLTRRLRIDWRAGALHFARQLTDADVANNCGNWQWVAGTGTDRRPGRVLNPLRQARRLDPAGDYVRRHMPELAHIGGGAVHEPWRLPSSERPRAYPAPIIPPDAIGAPG